MRLLQRILIVFHYFAAVSINGLRYLFVLSRKHFDSKHYSSFLCTLSLCILFMIGLTSWDAVSMNLHNNR